MSKRGVTLMAVRVEPALRDRVRAAAARRGVTMQDFVTEAIEVSLDRSRSEGTRVLEQARQELARALQDGAYSEYVASIDDPDLRTE